MPQTDPKDDTRARFLRRLIVAADEGRSYAIRVAALRAALSDGHPLKDAPDTELADRLTRPWDSRLYVVNGRAVERKVQRPPTTLRDVVRA